MSGVIHIWAAAHFFWKDKLRILVTADLHYRPAQRERHLDFARWVAWQQPDCFVLAGDVGHPLRLFQRGLQLFTGLNCPRLFIAGNHDLYRSDHDSRALWEQHLPSLARMHGFVWLEENALNLDGVAICGSMAWYDYSSRAPTLPLDDDEFRRLKHAVSHDADYIDWPWSDRAMARYLTKRFAQRLQQLEQDPTVRQIVVITHMPIFEQAIPHYPQSEAWNLLRAYTGNLTLGEIVRQQSKVTHVVSGHIHHPGAWQVQGVHRTIDFRVVGSKSGQPAAVVIDL
jgi:predicted phosphohydrolase